MTEIADKLRSHKIEYERISRNLRDEDASLRSSLQDLADCTDAQKAIQAVSASCQDKAHVRIASVVTRCLEAVFGADSYTFRIVFDRKRGKTEARLVFVKGGEEIDPLTAAGGGVVEVAALALRLACLVLSRPKRRMLLVLDEPLVHLSEEYRENVGQMLLTLSKEMGVQVIMVTHVPELAVGKRVEL